MARSQTAPVTQPTGQPTGTRQQLNPGARTEPVRRPPDIFAGPLQNPCPPQFVSSTAKVTLSGIDVTGATVLRPADIAWASDNLLDKPQPISVACEIRDRLANRLFQHGILARVEIPAQKLQAAGGRLQLEVIEARIGSVRYHTVGDVGPAQAKVEAYLEKLRGLAPFDLATAQRYLLLANEIPGMRVSAALVPATGANGPVRGGIDLDVEIHRKAIDELVAVQNNSSVSLGPWSTIARADFNSFTPLGERTSLIGYTALNRNEQRVVQVIEDLRPTASGLMVRGSIAYGESNPGDTLAPLKLHGISVVGTGEADYPLIHLERERLTLSGGFDWIDQKTEFPGGGLLNNDSLRVFWLKGDSMYRHDFASPTPFGYVSNIDNLTIEVRKGIEGLGASAPGAEALSRSAGRSDAVIVRADGQALWSVQPMQGPVPGLNLSFHFQGQYADRPLLAYEELAIGNLTIGRGYDPTALSGDRVIAAEVKLQTTPIIVYKGYSVAPYGFLDGAYVTNLDPGSVNQTVRSLGGGMEMRLFMGSKYLPNGLRADIAYAEPIDKIFPTAVSKPPPRLLVQLVAVF